MNLVNDSLGNLKPSPKSIIFGAIIVQVKQLLCKAPRTGFATKIPFAPKVGRLLLKCLLFKKSKSGVLIDGDLRDSPSSIPASIYLFDTFLFMSHNKGYNANYNAQCEERNSYPLCSDCILLSSEIFYI